MSFAVVVPWVLGAFVVLILLASFAGCFRPAREASFLGLGSVLGSALGLGLGSLIPGFDDLMASLGLGSPPPGGWSGGAGGSVGGVDFQVGYAPRSDPWPMALGAGAVALVLGVLLGRR